MHETLAVLFLFVFTPALLLLTAYLWRLRIPFTLVQTALFFVALLLTRFLWKVRGPLRLPLPPGGVVIVCNHRSSIDPIFLQGITDRQVHWMVAREYFNAPFFGWLLKTVGAIPVGRQGIDTAATKIAMRVCDRGGAVGMFPEGRINTSDELLLPARPGALLIALKTKVPILPCYVEGTPFGKAIWSPLFMSATVRVHCGELIDLSPYIGREGEEEVLKELTIVCMKAIAALAGRHDYQPRLAGRKWMPADPQNPADSPASHKDEAEVEASN